MYFMLCYRPWYIAPKIFSIQNIRVRYLPHFLQHKAYCLIQSGVLSSLRSSLDFSSTIPPLNLSSDSSTIADKLSILQVQVNSRTRSPVFTAALLSLCCLSLFLFCTPAIHSFFLFLCEYIIVCILIFLFFASFFGYCE